MMATENKVGEVRIQVSLINALDEELARRNQLDRNQVRRYEAQALVDTGAVRSCLPPHVVEQLGLSLRGQRVRNAAGS